MLANIRHWTGSCGNWGRLGRSIGILWDSLGVHLAPGKPTLEPLGTQLPYLGLGLALGAGEVATHTTRKEKGSA